MSSQKIRRVSSLSLSLLLIALGFGSAVRPQNALAYSVALEPASGPAGTFVTAYGSDFGIHDVLVVTWDDGSHLADTAADESGVFVVQFAIPSNASQGSHTVYFTHPAPGGGATYFWTASFTVTSAPQPGLADIEVGYAFASQPFESELICEGSPVNIFAGIENNGDAATGQFGIEWWLSDTWKYQTYAASLAPGGFAEYSYAIDGLGVGNWTVWVIPDFERIVPEYNEDNTVRVDFTVDECSTSSIDLTVSNVHFLDLNFQPVSRICEGDWYQVAATFTNVGTADSGEFDISWFLNNGQAVVEGHHSLGPGGSNRHSTAFSFIVGNNNWVMEITADHGNRIAESNESNNSDQLAFVVETCDGTPSPPPPPSRSVTLSPTSGLAGTAVNASGTNWPASASIQIFWEGGTRLFPESDPIVGVDGTFTSRFAVPGSASPGEYTVVFTDGSGSASATFTVISTPPPPPPPPPLVTVKVRAWCLANVGCTSATLDGYEGEKENDWSHTGFFVFKDIFADGRDATLEIFIGNVSCSYTLKLNKPLLGNEIVSRWPRIVPWDCDKPSFFPPRPGESKEVDALLSTWSRSDQPVASGNAMRTWSWGPNAFTSIIAEPYADAAYMQQPSPDNEDWAGQFRVVMYFDKSRMEITHPDGDPNSPWYVTNGLLVMELVTGRMQLGDNTFEQLSPAWVNVAGDADDPTGPTYATFSGLLGFGLPTGATIVQRVDRNGSVSEDQSLTGYGVTAAQYVPETGHNVASVFWEFMNSTGIVYRDGQYVNDLLFPNPFYATGFPITEAFWARVKVAGTYKDVLMQCFERRCLTYTPDNPDGWKVEAGNVGQHYYTWRYETPDTGTPEGSETLVVPFTAWNAAVTTSQSYSGPVTITVSGVGWTTIGTVSEDAFYVLTDVYGNPITPVHRPDSNALLINGGPASTYASPAPAYQSDHVYTFTINAPGGSLSFGISDPYTVDNSGELIVTIEPG